MSYGGTVIDGRVQLDKPVTLASGTRVCVSIAPEAKLAKGMSPQALLRMAGSLSDEDADALLRAAKECRQIDWSMWSTSIDSCSPRFPADLPHSG
jgi:hypothetical protein